MNMKQVTLCATAASFALVLSTAYAAGEMKNSSTNSASTDTQTTQPLTGKQKATAIGAGSGAVAGAVVGGPVGAVVGAGIGAVIGHEGTDAKGHVDGTSTAGSSMHSGSTVKSAQTALNDQGYNVGSVDGQWGPNTAGAVRKFQAERGLTQSGQLDDSTLTALGVSR